MFWFGDLNFRIEDYDIHVVKSAIENNKLSLLWERDQVSPPWESSFRRDVYQSVLEQEDTVTLPFHAWTIIYLTNNAGLFLSSL